MYVLGEFVYCVDTKIRLTREGFNQGAFYVKVYDAKNLIKEIRCSSINEAQGAFQHEVNECFSLLRKVYAAL